MYDGAKLWELADCAWCNLRRKTKREDVSKMTRFLTKADETVPSFIRESMLETDDAQGNRGINLRRGNEKVLEFI